MNHSGQASSEGQPYSGWIKREVHTTLSFIIIHCRAPGRAAMLKPQHLLWLPLTLHTAAMKSLHIIKITPRINTHLQLSVFDSCLRIHISVLGHSQPKELNLQPSNLQGNLPDSWATRLLHWYEHTNKLAQKTHTHKHAHTANCLPLKSHPFSYSNTVCNEQWAQSLWLKKSVK